MTSDRRALAHVRRLLGDVNTNAIDLAADLLNAVVSARDILADHADANLDVGVAFQILADAAADATPSITETP